MAQGEVAVEGQPPARLPGDAKPLGRVGDLAEALVGAGLGDLDHQAPAGDSPGGSPRRGASWPSRVSSRVIVSDSSPAGSRPAVIDARCASMLATMACMTERGRVKT